MQLGSEPIKTAAWFTRLQHEDITYSDDASLSALTVEEYELSPAFDPDITEYQVSVSKYTRNINITATPADEAATVSDTDTVSDVTGMKVFNKNVSLGNNTFDFLVKAEDGTEKTYTVKIKRGMVSYIRHLIDNEFLVQHNVSSFPIARSMLIPYMEIVSSKFTAFGMKVENSYQLFESLPDECEVANISNICDEHSPSCSDFHEFYYDTIERFPNIPYTADVVWSGNFIFGDYGLETYAENRSAKIGNNIFMLGTADWDGNAFIRTTIHEMAHYYNAPDHYHEYLTDGTCRAKEYCSYPGCYEGDDPAPRPVDCIMGEMDHNNNFEYMATSEMFCSGCRNDMIEYMESEGY